jgi:hypothetical protein
MKIEQFSSPSLRTLCVCVCVCVYVCKYEHMYIRMNHSIRCYNYSYFFHLLLLSQKLYMPCSLHKVDFNYLPVTSRISSFTSVMNVPWWETDMSKIHSGHNATKGGQCNGKQRQRVYRNILRNNIEIVSCDVLSKKYEYMGKLRIIQLPISFRT